MVRAAIQGLGMPHATRVYQSVIVGVTCTTSSDAQAPRDLIEAADAALHAAKHRGRNAMAEHGLVRVGDAGADAMNMAG
jgi:PleD family two-component response regulator